MSVQSWSLWMCLKEAFAWGPLCSWKSQQEFGRRLSVGRWQIPVQWDVYWSAVLSLAAASAFDIFSCFWRLTKNNYLFHEMILLYPPNRAMIHIFLWQHYPLLSELPSLLWGCVHRDVNFPAMVLLHVLQTWGACFQPFLWKHYSHQDIWEREITCFFMFSADCKH